MLDDLIQQGGARGVQEIIIGMAHRGRINVLVNLLGKAPQALFREFEGKHHPESVTGSGDVKYHMGFSSDIRTPGGNVHVVLAFNPSHLEIVNPVVEGSVLARQDRRGDSTGEEVLPVLIHGDAAFAGQGVVTETLQLSQARSDSPPAAQCTSSSTTRSASRPATRVMPAPDTNLDFIHDRDIVCRFTDAFNGDYDSHEKFAKNGLSSAAYPFENRCDKLYRNEINISYDHQGIHKNSCTDGEGLADFHRPDTVDGVEYRHEQY